MVKCLIDQSIWEDLRCTTYRVWGYEVKDDYLSECVDEAATGLTRIKGGFCSFIYPPYLYEVMVIR